MLVGYYPRKGKERSLLDLVRRHWPALDALGLVTGPPARVWRARDKRTGRVHFVEMFEWRDASASDEAHRRPEVMAIWGPMELVLEDMRLSTVEPVELAAARGRRIERAGAPRSRRDRRGLR